jgi:hypothetical protein
MAAENASWIEYPLVTGLMVFDRPAQYRAARASIDSFFAQIWPNRELVIYNATAIRLVPRLWAGRRTIREIRLKVWRHDMMLAICSANGNGEWCASWYSDCIYNPEYLSTHMAHRDKQRLVMVKHRQVLSLIGHEIAIVSDMAVPAWSFYRHYAVDFAKPITGQFGEVLVLDNDPALITQFVREIT